MIGACCIIGKNAYLEDTVLDRQVCLGIDVYCKGSTIISLSNEIFCTNWLWDFF